MTGPVSSMPVIIVHLGRMLDRDAYTLHGALMTGPVGVAIPLAATLRKRGESTHACGGDVDSVQGGNRISRHVDVFTGIAFCHSGRGEWAGRPTPRCSRDAFRLDVRLGPLVRFPLPVEFEPTLVLPLHALPRIGFEGQGRRAHDVQERVVDTEPRPVQQRERVFSTRLVHGRPFHCSPGSRTQAARVSSSRESIAVKSAAFPVQQRIRPVFAVLVGPSSTGVERRRGTFTTGERTTRREEVAVPVAPWRAT